MGDRKKALLFNDTSDEQHIGCSLVIKNIHRICKDRQVDIIQSFSRKALRGEKTNLVPPSNYDFIIVNGEGTLHHSPQASDSLLDIPINKPKILVNSVWEKMYCCSNFLSNFSFISVRESRSYNKICKSVAKEKVEIVPDLIFFDPIELVKQESIGYSDSVMTHVCDTLGRNKNFFPMQKVHAPSIGAYVSWMRSLDLLVTGRFHGVCLAMLLNVPFLAIPSNSHKIEGILEDCDCLDLLIEDLVEVEKKKGLAIEALDKTREYAKQAHEKIANFYNRVFTRI